MGKKKLVVTKETETGKNIEFKDVDNNRKMTNVELIKRLKTGNSVYNNDYCVKHDKKGIEYIASKPDGKINNNLG